MMRVAQRFVILGIALVLGGCAFAPGMYVNDSHLQKSLSKDRDQYGAEPVVYSITPGLIVEQRENQIKRMASEGYSAPNYEYRVGVGDILSVIVWDHPELTIPAGEYRSAEASGHLVGPDGTIFYPYVGLLDVKGKTTGEIRDEISGKLKKYIQNPQLDVRIAAYRSKSVLVTGQVKTPTVLPITDLPLTVLQAVNAAGGATVDADLRNVVISKRGKRMIVDLLSSYNGESSGILSLTEGDQVYIPSRLESKVFVLGEVEKPSVQAMQNGRMTLAEALALSSGMAPASADPSRVYVIRGDLEAPKVFHLDTRAPESLMLATMFQLEPNDVVYVGTASISRWNRLMSQIVPTVQALWQTERLVNAVSR